MGDSTVPQRKKASGAPLGKHRARLTDEEFAIMCWLRTNPKVASKYGITSCNGDTRIGSMLMQVLAWMGAVVEWRETLPASTAALPATGNAVAAATIGNLKARSGRKPKADPQPIQHAPPEAAIHRTNPRKRGRPKSISFPLLVRLAKSRSKRPKAFTSRGNMIAAPSTVALVEVRLSPLPPSHIPAPLPYLWSGCSWAQWSAA